MSVFPKLFELRHTKMESEISRIATHQPDFLYIFATKYSSLRQIQPSLSGKFQSLKPNQYKAFHNFLVLWNC